MWAAYNAMEAAIRMLRPKQHKNMEITDVIQRVADAYSCKPIENMLSHQLKRNKIGQPPIVVPSWKLDLSLGIILVVKKTASR